MCTRTFSNIICCYTNNITNRVSITTNITCNWNRWYLSRTISCAVAVAPEPLPGIANKGTSLYVWLASNPAPPSLTARVCIGPPTLSMNPCIAVADVESLTCLPIAKSTADDAWVVVWIPTLAFLGKVLIKLSWSSNNCRTFLHLWIIEICSSGVVVNCALYNLNYKSSNW